MTSYPAWVSTLSSATIAADFEAADVDGAVNSSGLVKLMTDLDASLATSGSTLTSAEFSDLKVIAANLNNGVATSSSLTYLFNALVDGNAANTTWTGGAAHSVSLGNLAVGANATELSELIGKWLQGTDLPSSYVDMNGYAPFSVTYSFVSNSLFAASGPSMSDVNQGYLGDCALLSSCAEVAYQDQAAIESMFTDLGGSVYAVRFYVGGKAEYVTVNAELADGGKEFNQASNIWASLVEKAWAQFQAAGNETGNSSASYGNSYSSIGNGADPLFDLEALTGASSLFEFDANGGSWGEYSYNASLTYTGSTNNVSTAGALAAITAALSADDDVILSSNTDAYDSSGKQTLVSDHALSIYGYDSATGELEVRNPWGTAKGQSWDTTFEISLSTLLADGDSIELDNAGAKVATSWTGAITNSAAYIAANFDAINASSAVTSITLNDGGTPDLALTVAQFTDDTTALGEITNALFEVTTPNGSTVFSSAANVSLYEQQSNLAIRASGAGASLVLAAGGETALLSGDNAEVWITANSDSATVSGQNDWAVLQGANQTVTATATWEWVSLTGTGDQATLSGDGQAVWATGSGDHIALDNQAQWAALSGANETLTANGEFEWIAMTGAGDATTLTGVDEAAWASSGSETITLQSTSEWAILTGAGDSVSASGGSEYIGLFGANESVVLSGSGESVWTTSSSAGITVSGASDNVFLGGPSAALTFVAISGQDTIGGFSAADKITLSKTAFANWTALANATSQVGADTLITLDANDSIRLTNFNASSLSSSQFSFA